MSETEDVQVKSAYEKALERAEEVAAETPQTEAVDAPVETTEDTAVKTETTEPKEGEHFEWPLPVYPLVAKFDVQSVELEDQSAIVVAIYTGAGASFGLMTRDGALALASRLKKAANSGAFITTKK